jgi:hypothetical protein
MSTTLMKTAEETVADTPPVASLLLMFFERHALELSDYLSREEQDAKLWNIQYAIRNWLMFQRDWSHAHATAVAKSYRDTLVMRLVRPASFRPAATVHA